MIQKLLTALYTDDNIPCFNKDSGHFILFCNEMGIVSININSINLDDTNYNEDVSETISHVRFLAWHSKFEKHKALKKELNEDLMITA